MMQNPSSFSQETQYPQNPPFIFPQPTPNIFHAPPSSLIQHPTSIQPIQSFPSYPDSMAAMQIPENFSMIFPGLKFCPSDDELIGYYLHNKIFGGFPLSCCSIIKDCDLYSTQEPWEIWDFYKGQFKDDEDLYFFTALKKMKSSKSKRKRFLRKIGSGSWMGEDAGQEIRTNIGIGLKKRYRYENKRSEHDGEWIMHEYSLLDHDEYVLCRIRKNDRPAKKRGLAKKRKSSEEVEHIDENFSSNKCFRFQNYQETVECEATSLANDQQNIHDFTEDIAADSSHVEAIFPGVTNDSELADLGDFLVDEEQSAILFLDNC
ncbi:hypothetical protein Patl1_13936 [Pistacia atlantica]|uniref:Uncharacterized protein n=1 Tax=Pistacia atlantica TaxID=434234 RepID=A0ACC1AVJ8_9ROSI|nr:hypothetical protein Patl1_13936 [Pistacia atlantica]